MSAPAAGNPHPPNPTSAGVLRFLRLRTVLGARGLRRGCYSGHIGVCGNKNNAPAKTRGKTSYRSTESGCIAVSTAVSQGEGSQRRNLFVSDADRRAHRQLTSGIPTRGFFMGGSIKPVMIACLQQSPVQPTAPVTVALYYVSLTCNIQSIRWLGSDAALGRHHSHSLSLSLSLSLFLSLSFSMSPCMFMHVCMHYCTSVGTCDNNLSKYRPQH